MTIRQDEPDRNDLRPELAWGGGATIAMVATGMIFVFGHLAGSYGWALFVGIPLAVGAASAWVTLASGYRALTTVGVLFMGVTMATGALLLAFGIEGVVCLIMASPIWATVGVAGAAIGAFLWFGVGRSMYRHLAVGGIVALSPTMLGFEWVIEPTPPVYKVVTRMVVDAPPQRVWPQVIAFAELPEPTEFIFRHGVAYPVRAEIEGQGVGAIRHCVFSTGAFVEPITEWNPPHVLAFDVIENPPALEEWSPYGHIHPPHTHGYFESHRGRFDLKKLDDGRTELVGTTWYQHGLWPASYWQLWSDPIIHRIHHRVLTNIKQRAERAEGTVTP